MYRYKLVVYWSEADQAYVVEAPELPGCMADGSSYAEAVENAQQVIADWIETARLHGRPVPEPQGQKLVLN
jgi:predicted RNase H-like HicB family nuclease